MDPQQRLLLEVAWEALEHAALARPTLAGTRTGVFVGISGTSTPTSRPPTSARCDAWTATGGALSIAANRLSYLLDLRGPSLAVDTACSSSLVAVHLACASLRVGRERPGARRRGQPAARPRRHRRLRAGRVPWRRTAGARPFDAARRRHRARRGLRRRRAQAARGRRATATGPGGDPRRRRSTHDGRSNGLTAPNAEAQEALCARPTRAPGSPRRRGLRRGARHRHRRSATRSRPSALGAVLGRGPRPGPAAADRLGQDQPRPPGGRRRHRRA